MKKANTRRSLLLSALSLLLCVSMLVGSTFAWFTDEVKSGVNKIEAGNLDIELYYGKEAEPTTNKVTKTTSDIFTGVDGKPVLWEPGAVAYANLNVVNEGSLVLKYQLAMNFLNENYIEGTDAKLSEVLKVAFLDKAVTGTREEILAAAKALPGVKLADLMKTGDLAKGTNKVYGVVIYWEPSAEDNRWNVQNGAKTSDGKSLHIDLGLKLVATQKNFESDAFGSDFDTNAAFPAFSGAFSATVDVTGKVDANNQLTEDIAIGDAMDYMSAVVPKGTALKPGTTELTLSVDTTDRSGNIEMTRGQVSRSLDVHISGIAQNNTVPATIDLGAVMPKDLKASSIQLYHVENGTPVQMAAVDTLSAHNQFVYTAATGEMSVNMATFSEVTAVVDAGNSWNGKCDTEWYNTTDTVFTITNEEQFAGFAAIVGGMAEGFERDDFAGKTIKLGADLDLGGKNGKVWYPVGYYFTNDKNADGTVGDYYCTTYSFEGTFDGQTNTIANIYQNTWEMKGDDPHYNLSENQYYNDGMGLFGFVFNGRIKNLTVDNFQSDGEYSTTGCVAAYASGASAFENITITNSNPRAYNVPNGGVVGYAYENKGATNVINFTNINIDTSNKITALWGSYDVGCGGILGRVNGATTVNMTNCVVSAEIDVFNDVCGNYQYYQYRYSGMLIGTVGSDSDPKSGPETVKFENVKVYIGNWADYYYCEFEKNSQGSYTEDFQFSRVEKHDINFNDETNMPDFANKPCKHEHTANEDKMGLYLPFNQLYTGYGWGSSPELITEYGKEINGNGVTVYRSFYSVTYMDATGKNVLATEYVTDGIRTDEKIWAAKHDVRTESITPVGQGREFKGWVNSGSVVVGNSIEAGNRNDIVLYESWDNPYTARFVDQFGNVIYSETFTRSNPYVSEPDVPKVEDFVGAWESYNLSSANSDITVKPIYTYGGVLKLTPVYENGVLVYYKVQAVDALPETVTIPGYVNGVPVKLVEKLYKNDNNWDFGSKVTTIIIKEGVEELAHNSLGYTKNLDVVYLPSTLKKLNKNAFSRNTGADKKQLKIVYNGTGEDFKQVMNNSTEKTGFLSSDLWYGGLEKGSTVECTDGVYTLTKVGGMGSKGTWTFTPKT